VSSISIMNNKNLDHHKLIMKTSKMVENYVDPPIVNL